MSVRRDTRARRSGAFTLIEMLAVVLLLGIVFLTAIDFYLDLSRASNAAAERTREGRRATAALDRVARDLSAAVLVRKPPEADPLAHPWLFLAERGDGMGASHLKLVSRGRWPRTEELPESDLEMVAWIVSDDGFGTRSLWRWSTPHLPESLDRSFPTPDAPGVDLVAEDLAGFGVRLLGEDGAWVESWDSTLLVESSELPLAAEITLAFADPEGEEFGEEPRSWQRQVLIPSRPLDLEALLEGGTGEEREQDEEGDEESEEVPEEERDCITVGQCAAKFPEIFQALQPEVLESIKNRCVWQVGFPEEPCR